MTPGRQVDTSSIWHPSFPDEVEDTAGLFVHFNKTVRLGDDVPSSLSLHVTANTRYKLFVNRYRVAFGPVKGDQHLWFYDEVDIAPLLHADEKSIIVVVPLFFHGTSSTPSFPKLLRIVTITTSFTQDSVTLLSTCTFRQ